MIAPVGYCDLVRVGSGGVGDVYRASCTTSGELVAIKVLRRTPGGSQSWLRARREIAALGALRAQRHVVRVREVTSAGDRPAIVMDFAPGGTVADLLALRGGRLEVAETRLIGRHTALGLASAHRRGIVHRDVKPGNLLVVTGGRVALADFGIATLQRSAEFADRINAISARYASPEELDDDAVTSASDVYSLGATLLHIGRGAPPTLRDRVSGWHPPTADDPDVASLDVVVERCLDPNPSRRPTASDVAVALFDARQRPPRRDTPVVATPAPSRTRARPGER